METYDEKLKRAITYEEKEVIALLKDQLAKQGEINNPCVSCRAVKVYTELKLDFTPEELNPCVGCEARPLFLTALNKN